MFGVKPSILNQLRTTVSENLGLVVIFRLVPPVVAAYKILLAIMDARLVWFMKVKWCACRPVQAPFDQKVLNCF